MLGIKKHKSENSFHFKDINNLKKDLKKKSLQSNMLPEGKSNPTNGEKKLIKRVHDKTHQLNLNNVTRTQAYLDFYQRHPEIEWALLGHMVSRNGGWNMTDLKGEFLSKLLTEQEQIDFYSFLERGNWLIFQDAYPQFLLYEESLRQGKALFHLLPSFGVSTFMESVWNHFWTEKNRYILAIALIINEQSYLEKRVVHNKHYQKTVLHTLEFKLQDLLSLNHILFPYQTNDSPKKVRLVGQTLHHFALLEERIQLGKRLYYLLFSNEKTLKGVSAWANQTKHTGSRKDFWPHLFNQVKESLPGTLYKPKVKRCTVKHQSHRIYSPPLELAWPNIEHEPAEEIDWFDDWRIIDFLDPSYQNVNGVIQHEYCETIEKLELAVFTKKAIFHWNK